MSVRVWRKGNPVALLIGMQTVVQPLWKTVWSLLKKLKVELPYNPATVRLILFPPPGVKLCFCFFVFFCCFLLLSLMGFQQWPEGDRICCTAMNGFRPFLLPCMREGWKDPGWALCLAVSGCSSCHTWTKRGAFRGLLLCTYSFFCVHTCWDLWRTSG